MSKYYGYALIVCSVLLVFYYLVKPKSCGTTDYDSGYNGLTWGSTYSKFKYLNHLGDIQDTNCVKISGNSGLLCEYYFDNRYGFYKVKITSHKLFRDIETDLKDNYGMPQKSEAAEWLEDPGYYLSREWHNNAISVTLQGTLLLYPLPVITIFPQRLTFLQ